MSNKSTKSHFPLTCIKHTEGLCKLFTSLQTSNKRARFILLCPCHSHCTRPLLVLLFLWLQSTQWANKRASTLRQLTFIQVQKQKKKAWSVISAKYTLARQIILCMIFFNVCNNHTMFKLLWSRRNTTTQFAVCFRHTWDLQTRPRSSNMVWIMVDL